MMSYKGSSGENSSEDIKGSSGGSIRSGTNGNQIMGKDNQVRYENHPQISLFGACYFETHSNVFKLFISCEISYH
jgi:hypothetical protein